MALRLTLVFLACLLADPALAQSEPQARARAERFLGQVVRVLPRIEGAPATDTGFGILVGERDGRLFIATPHHVAFGRQNAAQMPDDAPRVAFRGDPFTEYPARRLPVGSLNDDLAVLEVPAPRGFQAPRIARAAKGTVPPGTWAWNIGIAGDWDMPDRAGGVGPINPVSGWMRVGPLRTPPGASGGAVVTEDALLGMVLQDGNNFSLILPADRIVELFEAWRLPVNLLAPPGRAAERSPPAPAAPQPAVPSQGLLLPGPPQPLLQPSQPLLRPAAPAPPRAGAVLPRDCPECPELVVIPAGRFTMGSPSGEAQRDSEEGPQREVTVAALAVGRYEVTFGEWDACVAAGGCDGYRPDDRGWGRGDRPVINVSWSDAQAYVAWLSRRTGKTYRLLSEAEWEYAARAGTVTAFSTGAQIRPEQAQYNWTASYADSPTRSSSEQRTAPVGRFAANAFGLFDAHGNVWEWVQDCHRESYRGTRADGGVVEFAGCDIRGVRGGSWDDVPAYLRSAVRERFPPRSRNAGTGFRVARTLF